MSKKPQSARKSDTHRPDAKMRRRMLIICAAMAALTGLTVAKLFNTSITNNAKYEALANQNQFKGTTVKASRGSIYDSTGKILAQSTTVYTVAVAPKMLADLDNMTNLEGKVYTEQTRQKEAVAHILADNLEDVEYEDMLKQLTEQITTNPSSQWMKIASKVEKPVVDKILAACSEQNLANNVIFTDQDTMRYYPQHELAASVIGFTNYDGDGIYGVEAYYNDYLAGVDGKTITATDANGEEMPYKNDKSYSAKDGSSVYLTIDSNLQYTVEKNLDQAVEDYGIENRACAIMMNAKTGAILAMATSPGFDLDDRNSIYYYKDRNKLAEIDDAIRALPEGYDTVCTDGMFSQGEWQLLSIARAAAANPAVLLLDEITANLDAETEARVLAALRRASAGRTVLSVSHRIYENLGGRTVEVRTQNA